MEVEVAVDHTRREGDKMNGMMRIMIIVLDQVKFGWIDMRLIVLLGKDHLVRW